MNYLLNTYRVPIFIGYLVVNLGLLMLVFGILVKFESKIAFIKGTLRTAVSIVIITIVFFANLFTYRSLFDYFSDGKIKELYFTEYNGKPRLAVWFVRTDRARGTSFYSHRAKSYDLLSGKEVGRQDLLKSHPASFGFNIYKPNDHRAWAFSGEQGLQLLDLARSKIIADEAELLRRNPRLGKSFCLVPGNHTHDPVTQTIHVTSVNGSLFRLNNSLMAIPAKDIIRRPWAAPPARWTFEYVKGSQGKALHRIPSPPAQSCAKRATLLDPKIPKELAANVQKNKVWVAHNSSTNRDADPLISCLDANGREQNTINLKEVFNHKKVETLATLTGDNETLVFVSVGGYKLAALRTDSESGELKGRVDYL